MILSGILGALASLSFLLTLWQWLAARRFPLHRRSAELPLRANETEADAPGQSSALRPPPVTLLKPVNGCDEHTEGCLRSWFAQRYAGEIQLLFAVENEADPAGAVVQKLLAEFPHLDARLIVCPERMGANAKVSKLAQLEPHAKHEILVVSDADVLAPADLLANLVAPLTGNPEAQPSSPVGLVTCLYRLANPSTLAMRWEAIAINADFWSQVLQRRSLKALDFALGAAMALRRRQLVEIGGFRVLADHLADDYQLGRRIARRGRRIELCPVVVECWSAPMTWGRVWRHQSRWARTIRVCQPLGYFFSLLSNATFWPLLWMLAGATRSALGGPSSTEPSGSGWSALSPAIIGGLGFLVWRLFMAGDLQRRFTNSAPRISNLWLVPMKDLLQVALWLQAFTGSHIEWRGERFRLRSDGTLVFRDPQATQVNRR